MGILRGAELEAIEPLVEIVFSSGLRTIEISMNTVDAPKLIRQMIRSAKNRLTIGAGTVLTIDDLRSALDSGASFIVMLVLTKEVIEYCVKRSIPVFPGALTPQEIYDAWRAGAAMVKVFPAKFFGPEYIKEVKAPFQDIELLACGGVRPENIRSFFACGASAVAFGASVFTKERLARREFSEIGEDIGKLISAYKKVESSA